jgi:hypothetical protein
MDQQQDRQSQADDEVNPTRPLTQHFATGVIKTVTSVKTAKTLRKTDPFARLRRARRANLTCPLRSIPISTKTAIAAAPWIFIAQAFAVVSKSSGDGAR